MSTPTLHVFQVVWGFEQFGGLEHHLTELSLALAQRGRSVHVFFETRADPASDYVQRLRAAGVTVSGAGVLAAVADRIGQLPLGPLRPAAATALRLAREIRGATPRDASSSTAAATPASLTRQRAQHPVTQDLFRRLDAAAAEAAPSIVHVHGTRLQQAWVIAWAAARGIPTMYTEHVTLDEWNGAVDTDAIEIMRRDVGVLACVSERSRHSLLAAVGADRPVDVVRHVVPDGGPPQPLAGDGPLRLLCVARLERYKGIDLLLRALAIARAAGTAVHLSLAGDGAERATLEHLARSLGLTDVRFLGAVLPRAVGPLMQAADCVVFPSRGEGLPVALVEAMAHGRAVIATRAGGNAEAVTEGVTGFLVEPEDPERLAAAITSAAKDRARLQTMGAAAYDAWANGAWSGTAVVAHATALYNTASLRAAERRA